MTVSARVDERLVAWVWERQAFNGAGMEALGLRTVFRGLPSDAGGPDYQDALIERNGREIVSGDIEFHVRSSDWYRHGHHQDRAYLRVVLHVVWEDDTEATRLADGRAIPTVALGHWTSDLDVANVAESATQPSLIPHPCVGSYRRLSTTEMEDRVTHAGLERFDELSDRFRADLTCDTPDSVLYTALLEGLGHASNRGAFRRLAGAVPYPWLLGVAHDLWAPVLLDAAGLGPASPVPPPGRLPPDSWRLARLRPQNHPERRLVGVAALLQRLGPHLARALADAVIRIERPAQLRSLLLVPGMDGAAIGSGRADEIAVSAVLPFLAAFEQPDAARSLYTRYPSPPRTRWTRLMLSLLADAGHTLPVRTAAAHQGLHYLYHRHCRACSRKTCPVCDAG